MVSAMTALRLISLPAHSAFEFATGVATMAAPFVFGFEPAGTVIAVVIGALIAGLALAATSDERGSLPIAAHFAFDRGLVIGLLFAGVLLALAGDVAAATFLAVAGVVQLALSVTTRYSAPA
jgi:hypothetical protein